MTFWCQKWNRCTRPPSAGTYRPHHWWRTSSIQPSSTDQTDAGSTLDRCTSVEKCIERIEKERKVNEAGTKSQAIVIHSIFCEDILSKCCNYERKGNVIVCATFCVDEIRGGYAGLQNSESPFEMTWRHTQKRCASLQPRGWRHARSWQVLSSYALPGCHWKQLGPGASTCLNNIYR